MQHTAKYNVHTKLCAISSLRYPILKFGVALVHCHIVVRFNCAANGWQHGLVLPPERCASSGEASDVSFECSAWPPDSVFS